MRSNLTFIDGEFLLVKLHSGGGSVSRHIAVDDRNDTRAKLFRVTRGVKKTFPFFPLNRQKYINMVVNYKQCGIISILYSYCMYLSKLFLQVFTIEMCKPPSLLEG